MSGCRYRGPKLQPDSSAAEASVRAQTARHELRAREGARLPSEAVNSVIQFDRCAVARKCPSQAARGYASRILEGQEFSQTGRIVKVR
jgi:hypothetical protein